MRLELSSHLYPNQALTRGQLCVLPLQGNTGLSMTIEEQAVEVAKRQVLKKLADEEPYLFGEYGLYHRIKQFRNGTIQIQIRVKDGFVTDIVETEVKRYIFRKDQKTVVDNNVSDE